MISIRSRFLFQLGFVPLALGAAGCGDGGSPAAPPPLASPTATPPSTLASVSDDAALFRLVAEEQPFSGYVLFPAADELATGRLNGSEAHNPLVRVSLNARAMGALQGGRLPAGSSFPDGSIVFKELRSSASRIRQRVRRHVQGRREPARRPRLVVGGVQPDRHSPLLRLQPRECVHRLPLARTWSAERPRPYVRTPTVTGGVDWVLWPRGVSW